jgi:hypothetical protein
MSDRNDFAADPASRPGTVSAARPTDPKSHRDLRGDQAEGCVPCRIPRNLPSADDIDEQIRNFFKRGLV